MDIIIIIIIMIYLKACRVINATNGGSNRRPHLHY